MTIAPRNGGSVMLLRIAVIISYLVAPASAAWEDNHCVQCHEAEKLPVSLGHSFEDWRASSHARGGVGCEKCHGGDPAARGEEQAHRGVGPASDPKSKIHASRLASTCGACHPKELEAYDSTAHARQVADQQAAATCFTCHGSMATSLPTPADLQARCAVCHEKPVKAQAALTVLAAANNQLYRTRRAVDALKAVDEEWYRGAVERFHKLEETSRQISLEWHTFAMERVLPESRNLLKLGQLLSEEARLQMEIQRSKPTHATPPSDH